MVVNIDISINTYPDFIKRFQKFVNENKDLMENVIITPNNSFNKNGVFDFVITAKIFEVKVTEPNNDSSSGE